MNTPNNTLLGERSLAFLIRAAGQLVRAERADILASEGVRRHDLRLLRRLAGLAGTDAAPPTTAGTDIPTNGALDTDVPLGDAGTGDASTGDAGSESAPATEAGSMHEHRGHHRPGHRGHGPVGRARFGGFRLRHLLMRGWITFTDGRPTITAEGQAALTRIDDRLMTSRSRIESVLTAEQLTVTTDALSSIVEELGGDERLRDVRRRRRLMQHLREGGPRHGFAHRGFDGHGMRSAHVGHGAFAGREHGDCDRHGDSRGWRGNGEFRGEREFHGGGRAYGAEGFGPGHAGGRRHDRFEDAFSTDHPFRGRPASWGHRHADDSDRHGFPHGDGHLHGDGHAHGEAHTHGDAHRHGDPHTHGDGHRGNHHGDAHHSRHSI